MSVPRRALFVSLVLGLGCGPERYRPPGPEALHADLMLAVEYQPSPGQELAGQVSVDGRSIPIEERDTLNKRLWTHATRLAPGAHELVFHVYFEHADLVQSFERPMVPGCGPMRSTVVVPNDCINNSQLRPSSNWQWQTDAECEKAVVVGTKPGEELRLTFPFLGHGQCGVSCARRKKGAQELVSCDP